MGGLARTALELGDSTTASERCHETMSALESMRSEISDSDLRLSFFSSRHAIYDLCVETEIRRGDQAAAFDAAERGRGRFLLDQAAAAGVQAEIPGDLSGRIRDNDKKLAAAREELNHKRGYTPRSEVNSNVVTLLRQREKLRDEADESGLSGRLAISSLPLTEREIVGQLDPQTAMVAYWLGSDYSTVWLITSRGTTIYTLPAASELENKTKKYLDALLAPLLREESGSAADRAKVLAEAHTSWLQQGTALRKILLPMTIPQRIRHLVLIEDGPLFSLSFGSLPLTGGQYLGVRYGLVTEPSAAFAWRPKER